MPNNSALTANTGSWKIKQKSEPPSAPQHEKEIEAGNFCIFPSYFLIYILYSHKWSTMCPDTSGQGENLIKTILTMSHPCLHPLTAMSLKPIVFPLFKNSGIQLRPLFLLPYYLFSG